MKYYNDIVDYINLKTVLLQYRFNFIFQLLSHTKGHGWKSINDQCHYFLLLSKYHLLDIALNRFLPSDWTCMENFLIFKYIQHNNMKNKLKGDIEYSDDISNKKEHYDVYEL